MCDVGFGRGDWGRGSAAKGFGASTGGACACDSVRDAEGAPLGVAVVVEVEVGDVGAGVARQDVVVNYFLKKAMT